MDKRKVLFGTYDTDADGLWTLNQCKLGDVQQQVNLISVPGRRKGPLDLSTVLTAGEPIYAERILTVRLESSEGTRQERENRINTMINWLDGWRLNVVLPDDAGHYLTGRVHVAVDYNDTAHAAVVVTVTCEPWRYASTETTVTLTAAETAQTATLTNSGRMTVVPLLVVAGGTVNLTFGDNSWSLGAGTYQLPDLVLAQGSSTVTYSGSGTLTITYREAVL